MDEWEEGQELSDERDDDAMRERLADEERTRDEDAIQQDEHPIDMDTEEPDKKKKDGYLHSVANRSIIES